MSALLLVLFYVLGLVSAGILAFAVPEGVTRLNWWLRGYDLEQKR